MVGGELVGEAQAGGQVAIVTGGSDGIGRAVTAALLGEGASVVVCDLVDSGFFRGQDRVLTLTGDVADPELAQAAVAAAADRFGLKSFVSQESAHVRG